MKSGFQNLIDIFLEITHLKKIINVEHLPSAIEYGVAGLNWNRSLKAKNLSGCRLSANLVPLRELKTNLTLQILRDILFSDDSYFEILNQTTGGILIIHWNYIFSTKKCFMFVSDIELLIIPLKVIYSGLFI